MKSYTVVGNKKKVTLPVNSGFLKVVGSKCVVMVTRNDGEIEVVGNECRLEVTDNYGVINVVGYNCVVCVGKRWKGDHVNLIGQSTRLIVDGQKKGTAFEAQMSPFSKNLDGILDSIFDFNFVPR